MSDTQILTVILSTSMTLVVVVIGLFLNNRALDLVRNELKSDIRGCDGKIDAIRGEMRAEIHAVDGKVEALRDVLRADIRLVIDKLDSLDTRLTRFEERRA